MTTAKRSRWSAVEAHIAAGHMSHEAREAIEETLLSTRPLEIRTLGAACACGMEWGPEDRPSMASPDILAHRKHGVRIVELHTWEVSR